MIASSLKGSCFPICRLVMWSVLSRLEVLEAYNREEKSRVHEAAKGASTWLTVIQRRGRSLKDSLAHRSSRVHPFSGARSHFHSAIWPSPYYPSTVSGRIFARTLDMSSNEHKNLGEGKRSGRGLRNPGGDEGARRGVGCHTGRYTR